jgi:hypothetical protein
MQQKGYMQNKDWVTMKFEGAEHNEAAWNERVHIPSKISGGKTRKSINSFHHITSVFYFFIGK